MDLPEASPNNQRPNPYNHYLRYSSLAFQLLAAIGIFGWLGFKLDQYLGFEFPVFMLLFGLSAFGGMMYQLYKSINKP